ncbi:hypothetical protein UlMin_006146 [Ulmus minor]
MASIGKSPNPWPPFDTYDKVCSQGLCIIYCPQWCYILFSPHPPPPPFDFFADLDDDDNNSGKTLSPLIISVIGILAATFILLTYYTIISKFCCRSRNENNNNKNRSDFSVCLGEFEENQSLRLLPKCNHAFHLPCTDVWL